MGDFTTAGEVESVTAHEVINRNVTEEDKNEIAALCQSRLERWEVINTIGSYPTSTIKLIASPLTST